MCVCSGYSKNALVVGSTNIGPNRHIIGGASPVSGISFEFF